MARFRDEEIRGPGGRRQPYSVVLLDEQMPGGRGLELLSEIGAIAPAMPVVMVTQSEGDGTLREAIGVEVDDYLVKPVHPRQVLSVVTRLLEGDRIRQQRRARDFVTRFRELEAKRAETLAWREWIELVVELAGWEGRLPAAPGPRPHPPPPRPPPRLPHSVAPPPPRHHPPRPPA